MRGIHFPGDYEVEFIEVPDPTPGEGEVVLEMKASGICGSDLHVYRAPKGTKLPIGTQIEGPLIHGHEPCGVVAAVGPGVIERQAKVGDRVMVHHYLGCGHCVHCTTGWAQMCDAQPAYVYGMGGGHGGHAPYMKCAASMVVPMPDEISFTAGAAISCGTGTAYGALRRHGKLGGTTIAIFGQGPVGQAGTQFATAMGARVIAVDIAKERLDLAKGMGAAEIVNAAETDAAEAIRALTRGKGADHAMDCSGTTEGRHAAIASLRPWATMSLVGIGGEFSPTIHQMTQGQLTVFGSWTFSTHIQAECARFAAEHEIDVDKVFTDRYTFDDAVAAYEKTDKQEGGKGVFLI